MNLKDAITEMDALWRSPEKVVDEIALEAIQVSLRCMRFLNEVLVDSWDSAMPELVDESSYLRRHREQHTFYVEVRDHEDVFRTYEVAGARDAEHAAEEVAQEVESIFDLVFVSEDAVEEVDKTIDLTTPE